MANGLKAIELAKGQKEIGVAEFFSRNRHLLGFDNKKKALLTTIKEAVDNSIDACEEAGILPEVQVEIIDMKDDRFRVIVEDNGPGIVKKQIPKIFAKLLYGSKFHRLKMSLCGDEPIIVKIDGKTKLLPIAELVDEHLSKEGSKRVDNIKVPCFDWKEYSYSFRPASSLIKHKTQGSVYRIKTAYGRSIKVTGCHSLFTIDKDTLKPKEIAAEDVQDNDIILAPKHVPCDPAITEVNILDYLDEDYAKEKRWYLYTKRENVRQLFKGSVAIHKKNTRSRKYYRFDVDGEHIDVLDDSYKQYVSKGFVPVWLAKRLRWRIDHGRIVSYFHGKGSSFPLVIPITANLMRLVGLFCAEGHTDERQIGFTFSRHERDLAKLVCDVGFSYGINHTIEERPEKNSIRVKLFGGLLSYLFRRWCGHGAHQKKLPDFIFDCSADMRQTCLDYLYIGDGHNTKGHNQLILTTVSKTLANQVTYLWLMRGVNASLSEKQSKGYAKSRVFTVSVYGDSINLSNEFSTPASTKNKEVSLISLARLLGMRLTKEQLAYYDLLSYQCSELSSKDLKNMFQCSKIGYKIRYMLENDILNRTSGNSFCITKTAIEKTEKIRAIRKLLCSDFLFLPVRRCERLKTVPEYVYDIAVPHAENFVGGIGGIACHNSRGQQGIGISASVMYGQLTTGRPAKITSKIGLGEPAHYYELRINTQKNNPEIVKDSQVDWPKDQGTRIELDIEAAYSGGYQSVDQYLKETAIINPHVTIIYTNPKAQQIIFPRAIEEVPKETLEIKPHPYGVELGVLMSMLKDTQARTLQSFLMTEFSRVGSGTAKQICENAALLPNSRPKSLSRDQAEKLINGIKATKIIAPPADCIAPIGKEDIEKGLRKEINAEFYASTTRPPSVYRGNPFVVEAGIAYGGELEKDGPVNLMRFANRVPLLYQQGACAATKSIITTNWRPYGLSQSSGSIPQGPCTILVHIASVWVPFTSESKEAIAHYPEIIKEIKLALQECGRMLGSYMNKKKRVSDELKKRSYIERYIPHVASALKEIIGLKPDEEKMLENQLKELLERKRGKVDDIKFDPSKNVEYDEELAKIGKEDAETDAEMEGEAGAADRDKDQANSDKKPKKKESQQTLNSSREEEEEEEEERDGGRG